MTNTSMDNNDGTKEVYSQLWQHIRHIENIRIGFTTAYFTLLGGGVVLIFDAPTTSTSERARGNPHRANAVRGFSANSSRKRLSPIQRSSRRLVSGVTDP